jgi:hypothetical protein
MEAEDLVKVVGAIENFRLTIVTRVSAPLEG